MLDSELDGYWTYIYCRTGIESGIISQDKAASRACW